MLRRVRPPTVALYPALTLGIAFLSFGAATLLGGSGLLSVYATALVLGNSALPYHRGLARVHESLAWLSQIALFLMLGLLVFPSQLLPVAGLGLAVALFLAIVARPLAVALCLLPLHFTPREIGYVGWIGLHRVVVWTVRDCLSRPRGWEPILFSWHAMRNCPLPPASAI
jgi:cell volume regulation protein A